jgi:hypothetical protein
MSAASDVGSAQSLFDDLLEVKEEKAQSSGEDDGKSPVKPTSPAKIKSQEKESSASSIIDFAASENNHTNGILQSCIDLFLELPSDDFPESEEEQAQSSGADDGKSPAKLKSVAKTTSPGIGSLPSSIIDFAKSENDPNGSILQGMIFQGKAESVACWEEFPSTYSSMMGTTHDTDYRNRSNPEGDQKEHGGTGRSGPSMEKAPKVRFDLGDGIGQILHMERSFKKKQGRRDDTLFRKDGVW